MKALTLTQPWATLVAIGAKRIETRSWRTNYRGPLAIHAAKEFPRWCQSLCWQMPFTAVLWRHFEPKREEEIVERLPRGAVIATGYLIDCAPTERLMDSTYPILERTEFAKLMTPIERAFGDFSPSRWGWIFKDMKRTSEPIPAKGMLGLWEWFSGEGL